MDNKLIYKRGAAPINVIWKSRPRGRALFRRESCPVAYRIKGFEMEVQHIRSRENRLRREARRQGLTLLKSRARDPNDETFGGYMLVYRERNAIAFGAAGHKGRKGYSLSLDGVEAYLRRRERAEGMKHIR